MSRKCLALLYTLILASALCAEESETFAPTEDVYWIDVGAPQISESELLWLNSVFNASTVQEGGTNGIGSALNFIEAKIQNGTISAEDRSSIGILERISLYPYTVSGQGNRGANLGDRNTSIQLLGMLGGEHSLEAIDAILRVEEDPALVRTIFTVYSDLAPPLSDMRIEYFTHHLKRAQYVTGDDSLILTILQAVEAMYRSNWTLDNAALFAEILVIQDEGRTEVLRNYAYSIARLLAGL